MSLTLKMIVQELDLNKIPTYEYDNLQQPFNQNCLLFYDF